MPWRSVGQPPAVVRARFNRPTCIAKARATSSCIPPQRASSNPNPVPALPLMDSLAPLMQSVAAGSWQGVPPEEVRWSTTHASFGMPRGVRYLNTTKSGHVNAELGVHNAWLPVMRTYTQQDALQVGLWFHYMRGCSDFAWNVGRTLLVRNKCEAAVRVEQRAHNASWASAVVRVNRKLSLAAQRASFHDAMHHFSARKDALNESSIWPEADGRRALDRCARGWTAEAVSNSASAAVLNALFVSNALDYVIAATLAAAAAMARHAAALLDTVQFTNQCASPVCDGNVEIWDVRSLQHVELEPLRALAQRREARLRSMRPGRVEQPRLPSWGLELRTARSAIREDASFASPPIFRRLNGSLCSLSRTWHQCVACARSESEEACFFKCTDLGRRSRDPSQRYVLAQNGSGTYGHHFPTIEDHAFLSSLPLAPFAADVLPLALRWSWAWGVLLGSVPPDPPRVP